MDYYKELKLSDCPSWDDYMLERIRRGLKAGCTFHDCYVHWLAEFRQTLDQVADDRKRLLSASDSK